MLRALLITIIAMPLGRLQLLQTSRRLLGYFDAYREPLAAASGSFAVDSFNIATLSTSNTRSRLSYASGIIIRSLSPGRECGRLKILHGLSDARHYFSASRCRLLHHVSIVGRPLMARAIARRFSRLLRQAAFGASRAIAPIMAGARLMSDFRPRR